VGTLILQAQDFRDQLIRSQGSGMILFKLLADLEILAKYTAEIAAGKKNGP